VSSHYLFYDPDYAFFIAGQVRSYTGNNVGVAHTEAILLLFMWH